MTPVRRNWSVRSLLGAGALLPLLLIACNTLKPTAIEAPKVAGATFVGNAACGDCHQQYTRIFAASPHGRLHSDTLRQAGETGCESCHGPASRHVATGGLGVDKFIVNPGKDASACLKCHLQTAAEFRQPNHHYVTEGRLNCAYCHDPHGRDARKPTGMLAHSRIAENCADCHREQARRFVFEHEALREGCSTCHHPHGSINQKLLLARDGNLCLKCHAQTQGAGGTLLIGNIDHSGRLAVGSCWAGGCHSAVHGSNVDHRLRF